MPGRGPIGRTGWSCSASTRRSSRSSTTSSSSARRCGTATSTIRSPSTTTTRVWRAFDNHYWPALYLVDRDGVIRDHHFGEGRYEQSERSIQKLLGVDRELVAVEGEGVEAEADWEQLGTPETYLGYLRGERFSSPGDAVADGRASYELPDRLRLNHWALAGEWTIDGERIVLGARRRQHRLPVPCPRRAHRAQQRARAQPIPFRVLLDGEAPGPAHGVDVDADGHGVLREGRMYGLLRQPGEVRERTLEIAFLEPRRRGLLGHVRIAPWPIRPRHPTSPSACGSASGRAGCSSCSGSWPSTCSRPRARWSPSRACASRTPRTSSTR